MAAVPSRGRASTIEGIAPAEAELTRALYEQYAHQIFRYCLHQLGSREEAEDAVQSTFLNAFRGIKRGIVPELESAWLFKIAHNVCLSRRRSSWRRGRVESPADFEVVEELAPAPSRRSDELIGLQDVLEEMPENQRRAILLREWQGLSYREIAEELDLSQAAIETLIFRARRTLASGLEQPPERRRVARAADWGNVVTALKSLVVGGSAAAKVAATVAAVSATTVVAAEPIQHYRAQHHPPPVPVTRHAGTSANAPKPKPAQSAVVSAPSPAQAHVHPLQKVAAARPHRRPAKAVSPIAGERSPVPAETVTPAPVQQQVVQQQVVEQAPPPPAAPAPAPSGDKQAAKDAKRAAKDEKHAAPTQQAVQPQPSASGTNPAGKEKEHGRWARGQQSAPPAVVAPSPTPGPTMPVLPTPAPIDQVQPIDVPDAGKPSDKHK